MAKKKWTKEEIDDYRKNHGLFFYFNKEDSNIFIPKAFGFGFTINWANPISWILVLVIFGFIVLRRFLK